MIMEAVFVDNSWFMVELLPGEAVEACRLCGGFFFRSETIQKDEICIARSPMHSPLCDPNGTYGLRSIAHHSIEMHMSFVSLVTCKQEFLVGGV